MIEFLGSTSDAVFFIRIGQYYFRLWKNGFEYGNKFGGRYVLFYRIKK